MPGLNDEAGAPGTITGEGQEPSGVSSQEKPAQGLDETTEPTGEEAVETTETEAKADPLHTHPAFQRQQRRIRGMSKHMREQGEALNEAIDLIKQMKAEAKGETYTPAAKGKPEAYDLESILDDEVEALAAQHELSAEDQVKVTEIALKYGTKDADGNIIPMEGATALALWKDMNGAGGTASEPTAKTDSEKKVPAKKTTTVPRSSGRGGDKPPAKPERKRNISVQDAASAAIRRLQASQ